MQKSGPLAIVIIALFTYMHAKPIAQMCIEHILLFSVLSTKGAKVVHITAFFSFLHCSFSFKKATNSISNYIHNSIHSKVLTKHIQKH